MKTFTYTIRDEVGIHARPAGMLVNKVKEHGCRVTLSRDGKTADASRLFSVMSLGVKHGDTITVTVEGDGEESAEKALSAFFEQNL